MPAPAKIIAHSIQCEPGESIVLYVLIVYVEQDTNLSSSYKPVSGLDPSEIIWEIYKKDRQVDSGHFATEVKEGFYATESIRAPRDRGVYLIRFYEITTKTVGIGQLHVAATHERAQKGKIENHTWDRNNLQVRVNDKGVLNDPSVEDIDAHLSAVHGAGSWETADVSGLALESTVQAIKSQTDKMQFDESNHIKSIAQNPELANLDVPVSSRASQSSVDAIPTNPLLENDPRLPGPEEHIAKEETLQTKADQSTVLAIKDKTDNLPSDPASQSRVEAKLNQLEANIRGSDNDDLKTLSDQLDAVQADLDNPDQYKADVSAIQAALNEHRIAVEEPLRRILGLVQENFRLCDLVYTNGQLTAGKIKIYANASDCQNDTNPIAEYQINAQYDAQGNLISYMVTKL